jgi:adenylate cyclase
MLAAASRWVRRAAELAAKPGGRDEDRLASGLFLLVTGSGAAAGLLWALAYALLGRPLSAAVPGTFAVVAAVVGSTLVRRRDLGRRRELMLLLILLLPAVLQASLGGYVKGRAVVMWSFLLPSARSYSSGRARAGHGWQGSSP